MIDPQQTPITPREILRVLFRQRRRMLTFFSVVIAATLLTIALYPRSYTSESKLFIRVGRESVALDPTATTGQTIMLQKTQVDEVNSALQVLSSREVYRQVVARVGAERILDDAAPANAGQSEWASSPGWMTTVIEAKNRVRDGITTAMAAAHLSDPGTPEEMAVRKLENGVQSFSPKDSTVITIAYSAASPQLAHDVVEAMTNVFLEEHVRVNRTEGSLKFFSEQASKLQSELKAAQDELRDRKNEYHVTSIENRRAIFSEQEKDVELQMLSTQRELAYAEAEINDLTKVIAALRPELVTNRVAGFANEGKERMREKLYELEIEESKLRSRFKEDHPLLAQIERQRQEAAAILKDLPNERTQTTEALNPNQRTLELELAQAKAKKEALQAKQSAAAKQRDELTNQLKALNEQEVELDQLARKAQILEGNYRLHVEKMEQARVNDALGKDSISNITVPQQATLVGKPSSPKKALLLGFGVVVATAGAFALAFLSEIFDETLRTPEQIEGTLGVPVLLTIPHRKRRRRRKRTKSEQQDANGGMVVEPNGSAGKRYRGVIRQLMIGSNGRAKAIGVAGCDATMARSRVAAGLATAAAGCTLQPVLLIDADARYRRVARRFGLNGSPGWREVVAGTVDAETCVHKSKEGRLAVMTSGSKRAPAAEQRCELNQRGQLEEIKSEYGLVIVDVPPAAEFDAPPSSAWLDEMVLVIEAEKTRRQTALRIKESLERVGVRVAGVILANTREHIPSWLGKRL